MPIEAEYDRQNLYDEVWAKPVDKFHLPPEDAVDLGSA